MTFFLLFNGIALSLVFGVVFLLFRWLRRWGLAYALSASVFVLVLLVLLFPIPTHGGFLFLGQVMYDEWSHERTLARQASAQVSAVQETLPPRFSGVLPFTHSAELANGWTKVIDNSGATAVLDASTGLIWSGWSALRESPVRPTVAVAKAHCAAKQPQGYWALATTAEEVLMWQAGGDEVMPEATTGWVSYSTDITFNLELLSTHLRSPSSNQRPRDGVEIFSVRCVARSSKAPEWGYTRDDVDLTAWNEYQLSRL